jgi:hypothetical protein
MVVAKDFKQTPDTIVLAFSLKRWVRGECQVR